MISEASEQTQGWLRRLHLTAAVLVVWAALHYGAGFLAPRGNHRPLVLFGYAGATPAAIAVAMILLGGTALTRLLARERPAALTVAGLALGLWVFPFGTMDDWLKDRHPAPSGPTSGPYLLLIPDYLYFGVLLLAVASMGGHLNPRSAAGAQSPLAPGRSWSSGVLAACISSGIAAALLWLLSGPRAGATYRLQVYFAVAVAFYVSTLAACRIAGTRQAVAFWPAPLIVGLAGALWAALHPAPPAPYAHLNIIPAVPLVRPLPVEMLSVGLLATQAALRPAAAASAFRREGR
jgi:hypothetical protein